MIAEARSGWRGNGGTKAQILDPLARVLFLKGDREQAIAVQQKADECSGNDLRGDLENVLAGYTEGKLPPADSSQIEQWTTLQTTFRMHTNGRS